jgi:hypothetical protein
VELALVIANEIAYSRSRHRPSYIRPPRMTVWQSASIILVSPKAGRLHLPPLQPPLVIARLAHAAGVRLAANPRVGRRVAELGLGEIGCLPVGRLRALGDAQPEDGRGDATQAERTAAVARAQRAQLAQATRAHAELSELLGDVDADLPGEDRGSGMVSTDGEGSRGGEVLVRSKPTLRTSSRSSRPASAACNGVRPS